MAREKWGFVTVSEQSVIRDLHLKHGRNLERIAEELNEKGWRQKSGRPWNERAVRLWFRRNDPHESFA